MALSMFARTPGCLSPVFQQVLSQVATKPAIMQRMAASNLPSSLLLKETSSLVRSAKTTPILNAVRSLRTSPVQLSAAAAKGHDHAKLWVIERGVSALLVPLIPAALIYPNQALDYAIAVLMVAHSFWGLEAIAVDYARASVVGPVLAKAAIALVYLVSIATLGGLFYLISHDVGIGNAVRNIWSVKSDQSA